MTDIPVSKSRRSRMNTLSDRLREHEGLVRALRDGEVDAVVVQDGDGARLQHLISDEPLYHTIVDSLPQGVATVLSEGTITYVNRHLAASLGLAPESLLGTNLGVHVAPAGREPFAAMLRRAAVAPQDLELSFRWEAGEGPVLLSARRLPMAGVEAIGLVVVDLRDQVARHAAEEASRSKDELITSVSHEMRTPLTSIMGWVQLLEYELRDQDHVGDALRNLKNAVLAEAKIVDDLLDLARAEKGSLSIALKALDLRETLRTAVSFVARQAEAKSLGLTLSVPEESVGVQGDPDRLRQVFVNLLTNAVKFTAQGAIDVRCTSADGQVRIDVADTGLGIKPEAMSKVFDAFWRSDRVKSYPGLGIGLAITRRLVEAHGGAISVASDGLGLGTRFTVTLPVSE